MNSSWIEQITNKLGHRRCFVIILFFCMRFCLKLERWTNIISTTFFLKFSPMIIFLLNQSNKKFHIFFPMIYSHSEIHKTDASIYNSNNKANTVLIVPKWGKQHGFHSKKEKNIKSIFAIQLGSHSSTTNHGLQYESSYFIQNVYVWDEMFMLQ